MHYVEDIPRTIPYIFHASFSNLTLSFRRLQLFVSENKAEEARCCSEVIYKMLFIILCIMSKIFHAFYPIAYALWYNILTKLKYSLEDYFSENKAEEALCLSKVTIKVCFKIQCISLFAIPYIIECDMHNCNI